VRRGVVERRPTSDERRGSVSEEEMVIWCG
jgi:hypothetical protein